MGLIISLFNWAKAFILWLCNPENRKIGIKHTKKVLDMITFISKKTKNRKDELAAAFIAKQFDKAVRMNSIMDSEDFREIADCITMVLKGSLTDVYIRMKQETIDVCIGEIGVNYDPSDGAINML